MMDMMTIIPVFLLKSLPSSSANIPRATTRCLPCSIDTAPSNAPPGHHLPRLHLP